MRESEWKEERGERMRKDKELWSYIMLVVRVCEKLFVYRVES